MVLKEYEPLIENVIKQMRKDSRFPRMTKYKQHGSISIYEHSISIAYTSCWIVCTRHFNVDYITLIRGALLHDYFLYDWHDRNKGCRWHALSHLKNIWEHISMILSEIFLCFFFYSLFGWLYESLLCSIFGQGRFINRGFLLGPYCPIYGTGAILCWLILRNNTNIFAVFAIAGVLCCAVEYITSFCMEKAFHARWWDYSNMPFQLHGRICLYGSIIFGAGVVVIRFFVQPTLMQLTASLNERLLNGLALALFITIGIDIVLTLGSWKGLNKHLSILHNAIYNKADGTFSKLSERFWDTSISSVVEKGHGLFIRVQNINVKLEPNELRFFRAFPKIHIPAYEGIVKQLQIKEKVKRVSTKKKHQKQDDSPDVSVEDVI